MNLPNINDLRAVSIKQPWATLISKGYKNIENRVWSTNGKWVLIHSSKEFDKNPYNTKPEIINVLKKLDWKKYPTSQIIGIMYIDNVEENCDVNRYFWATGPVCWHISFVYHFRKPIENVKGQLRLWKLTTEMKEHVKTQLGSEFINKYYIYQFGETFNTDFIRKLSRKYHHETKLITQHTRNKVPETHKTQSEILYNYFYYPKPTIKPNYPNKWQNSKGFVAVTLNLEGVNEFEQKLLQGANKWFHSHLSDTTSQRVKDMDISNKTTLANVFDTKWKKANLTPDEINSVRHALDGGGNAQFHPYKGWRQSGFGIWAHLRGTKFILTKVIPSVLEQYKTLYGGQVKSRSLPHIIYKPPIEGSGELKPHNDSGTWNDMYTRCQHTETLEQWVENYGIQTLVHLKGARKNDGGQTTLLGPMDVHIYFIILQMIHPKTPHPDLKEPKDGWNKEWITAFGPKFFTWYNPGTLKVINRILSLLKSESIPTQESDRKWIKSLKENHYWNTIVKRIRKTSIYKIDKIKMLPEGDFDAPYLIAWPNGFIHGSDKTGKEPRLTVTIPYTSKGDKEKSTRGLKRLTYLARGDLTNVLRDTTPYEDGIVHTQTKTEVNIYPFFKDVMIDETDIPIIKNILHTDEQNVIVPSSPNDELRIEPLTENSWLAKGVLPEELQLSPDEFETFWNTKPGRREYIRMFGREVQIPREQQVYGVEEYEYSGVKLPPKEITPFLRKYINWANRIDKKDGHKYSMILVNWYNDGKDYIGYHRDNERMIIPNTSVMTISFGGQRKLRIQSNDKQTTFDVDMINNQYVVMGESFQREFKHSIPKSGSDERRISITLRKFR